MKPHCSTCEMDKRKTQPVPAVVEVRRIYGWGENEPTYRCERCWLEGTARNLSGDFAAGVLYELRVRAL